MKRRLIVRWDKRQNDFVIQYPAKFDGHLANDVIFSKRLHPDLNDKDNFFKMKFGPSFMDELKERGYDTTTFRMEIRKAKEADHAGK